jgi:alpha-amylase/alpha-mannosidase (GH57 family)
MNRNVCVHGHFYQPPRENPWLEDVERQESAHPFHDWNERVTAECYGPNAWSRILDQEGFITRIVSNYGRISFNFGPTLLSWMERARPDVYEAILAADRASIQRFGGHGSALAQAYNHSILPLCSARDRVTQLRWGIRDFERRFERRPEGIWLPETAVDTPTLEAVAAEGIAFTILAPHQSVEARALGTQSWIDVSGGRLDPKRPYVVRLPSGAEIVVFFYDGPVSQAVAFERLLTNGDRFANRLIDAFDDARDERQLVHIATDGETYGHHHRHGDMALAYAISRIEDDPRLTLTNYGEYLSRCPPTHEARIAEKTSWSCAHGIERWRSDCGCHSGSHAGWKQHWRAPLRQALDWLAEQLAALFEARSAGLLSDPWRARDAYIDVLADRRPSSLDLFFEQHAQPGLSGSDRRMALKLLEIQRHAMLMFTSCGWFFDEVSGIETTQILRYAARAVQLAEEVADVDIEEPFLERLSRVPSNLPEHGDARRIYEACVRPVSVNLPKLVAHYAVSSLFHHYEDQARVFAYRVDRLDHRSVALGRARLAVGKVRVTEDSTEEAATLSFGIVHLGDHNMSGGVREFKSDTEYEAMCESVIAAFESADMPEVLRLLDQHFIELTYSMRSLFRDEQRRVLDIVLAGTMSDAEALSSRVYETHAPVLRYMGTLDQPLPTPLRSLAEFVLNSMLRQELDRSELDFARIRSVLDEAEDLRIELDRASIELALQRAIERTSERWARDPEQMGPLGRLRTTAELAGSLPIELDLSLVQNRFYQHLERLFARLAAQARDGDAFATEWTEHFVALGRALRIRVQPGNG